MNLEIAIAVETGEWETLGAILATFLDSREEQTGLALIRAAHLAHSLGQGPTIDLMEAAVRKAPDDPNVLLGAYTLVMQEGLEEQKPEAAEWFSRALDLSGSDGPIKRFELKDLLSQHHEWNRHTREVTEAIVRGDLPFMIAAPQLRKTLIDIILGVFVQNASVTDPRKRTAVPLFSGHRIPKILNEKNGIALDLSALMTLSWLGLLPKVISVYPKIQIPGACLSELFAGRERILEFQKSRFVKAKMLRDFIDRGLLKVTRSLRVYDELEEKAGIDLAKLIRSAKNNDGTVIRPPPVHQIGNFDEVVDLTSYESRLSDMRSLLDVLVDNGVIDPAKEETARRYFEVQDSGWATPAIPKIDRPLYLDGLAVDYLEAVDLLKPVLDVFDSVYVSEGVEEQASSLFEYEQQTTSVLGLIDNVRNAIRVGNNLEKVVFGPQSNSIDEQGPPNSSSMNLIRDLNGVDAVVFDDRAINKAPFVVDNGNHKAEIFTTLDVIEDLLHREEISDIDRSGLRHRLRLAGALLLPIDTEEIIAAALRNHQKESPEFRAIRESICLARISELPRFPNEINWFSSLCLSVKAAIFAIWTREEDRSKVNSLADAIFELMPDPREWEFAWNVHCPPNWTEVVNVVILASLALPFEILKDEEADAYNNWFEHRVLEPIRSTSPNLHSAIVNHIKSIVITVSEDGDESGT